MIILVYFPFLGEGMDEMEFTEAESNMNDLVSEYQQYQVPMFHFSYIYHHSYLNMMGIHIRKYHFQKTSS